MMVVVSGTILSLKVMHPFEELMKLGLVRPLKPESVVTFISHQWLGRTHPDPGGVQLRSLQRFLEAGERNQLQEFFSQSDWGSFKSGRSGNARKGHRWFADMAPAYTRHGSNASEGLLSSELAQSFVWIDYLSVPQNTEPGDDSQFRAISSIPYYIEKSSFFIVVCPSARHETTGEVCDYESWLQRGWCRMEVWCNALSHNRVVPLVLTDDSVWTIGIDHFFRLCGQTRLAVVGCGDFTCCRYDHRWEDGTPINCDRDYILPILERMWLSKVREARDTQNPFLYGTLRMIETRLFVLSPEQPYRATWGNGSSDQVSPELVFDRIEADYLAGQLPTDFCVKILAAGLGDERVLRACAQRGYDLTAVDLSGDSCLQTACSSGSIAAAHYMLSLPGTTLEHINRPSKSSYTPLHEAVLNEEIVRMLLRWRAEPAPRNRYGLTPLHIAAKYGQDGAVGMLLEAGAPADAQDQRGKTALHIAAEGVRLLGRRRGRLRAMQCLLRHGASWGILDSESCTAGDVASRNGFQAAVDLLRAAKSRRHDQAVLLAWLPLDMQAAYSAMVQEEMPPIVETTRAGVAAVEVSSAAASETTQESATSIADSEGSPVSSSPEVLAERKGLEAIWDGFEQMCIGLSGGLNDPPRCVPFPLRRG